MTMLRNNMLYSFRSMSKRQNRGATGRQSLLGLVSLFCLCFCSIAFAQDGGLWMEKTPMPAAARVDHAACAVNGNIYVLGGAFRNTGGDLVATSRMDIYDPATDTWSNAVGMPTPRVGLSVTVMDNIIYAIGGQLNYEFTNPEQVAAVEAYDPNANSWSTKAPLPLALSFFSTDAVNGKIYLIGGRLNGFTLSGSVYEYDPATDAWKNIVFFADQARNTEFGAAAYNGQIILIGGDQPPPSGDLFYIFDPASKSWSQSASLLQLASQMQAHVIGQSVVVAGGSNHCHHGCGDPIAQTTVQLYSIADSSWQLATEMPEPRLGYASAVVANKLYVFGGASKRISITDATLHANTYEFTPPASVTSVEISQGTQPEEFTLRQNHPNPFNPSTTIQFTLAKRATVKLTIFDILGREVAVLVHETLDRGSHNVIFEPSDLASGIYFYRLQAGAFVQTKKLTLLR